MIARSLALALAVSSIACGASTPHALSPSSTPPAPSPSSAPSAASSSSTPSAASPTIAATEAQVLSADGVSIHYVVEGRGPVVVFLHCLGCNLHYWDVAAADLARDHRVVRLDLAGHGASGADRKTWSIDAFVGDVRAVADAAAVDEFLLVGHSMSGPIALETALQLGPRVTGVVPIDTLLDVEEHIPPAKIAEMSRNLRAHYREFTDKILPGLLPQNPDPEVVARVRADALAMDPDRSASILESIFAYRADAAMDRLAIPIVAIDADRRPLALDHERAHAPQFDARVIKDSSHWLMLDKPAEFTSALRDVVESMESGKAKRRRSVPVVPAP